MIRKPRTVATIREGARKYNVGKYVVAEGDFVECMELLPKSLRIVVYTEDPGFFLDADESESFFYSGGFIKAFGEGDLTDPDRFEVVDHSTWRRLLAESKRYKINLNRRRARIQKKEREAYFAANPQA